MTPGHFEAVDVVSSEQDLSEPIVQTLSKHKPRLHYELSEQYESSHWSVSLDKSWRLRSAYKQKSNSEHIFW